MGPSQPCLTCPGGTGPPELAWAQPNPWLGNVGFQGLGVLPKIPWLPPPTHPSRDSDPSQSRVQIDVLGWDTLLAGGAAAGRARYAGDRLLSGRELRHNLWDKPQGNQMQAGLEGSGATCVAMTEMEVAHSRCSGRLCTHERILLRGKSKALQVSLGVLETNRAEGRV